MAYHLHRQIRDAIGAQLTGLGTTGNNVFANRLRVVQESELPALRIYLDAESADMVSMTDDAILQRTITLSVEAIAKATSALDDVLDQISMEVEQSLAGLLIVGVKLLDVVYSGMTFTDQQLDQPVGVKRMTFTIVFEAAAGSPDTFA